MKWFCSRRRPRPIHVDLIGCAAIRVSGNRQRVRPRSRKSPATGHSPATRRVVTPSVARAASPCRDVLRCSAALGADPAGSDEHHMAPRSISTTRPDERHPGHVAATSGSSTSDRRSDASRPGDDLRSIVSDDLMNTGPSGLVIAVPMTTRRRDLPCHVEIDATVGLDAPSYAKCEDVKSISTERLTTRHRRT